MQEVDAYTERLMGSASFLTDQEGGVVDFFQKTKILQEYADDYRVESICEIGFNAGHSAAFLLAANPTASFVSFDNFHHNYSAYAARSVHALFPQRRIVFQVGDSRQSVLRFHETFPDFKCNLMFVGDFNMCDCSVLTIQLLYF